MSFIICIIIYRPIRTLYTLDWHRGHKTVQYNFLYLFSKNIQSKHCIQSLKISDWMILQYEYETCIQKFNERKPRTNQFKILPTKTLMTDPVQSQKAVRVLYTDTTMYIFPYDVPILLLIFNCLTPLSKLLQLYRDGLILLVAETRQNENC